MNGLRLDAALRTFFEEDIASGDISAEAVFSASDRGEMTLYAKDQGIFCGGEIIRRGFSLLDEHALIELNLADGDVVATEQAIARVQASVRSLLSGERVVLNLIQRMSGVATATADAVRQTHGTCAKICDTRKTMPGLRLFDKYAVRAGGGYNHRMGLFDCVMLKDNHIAFSGSLTHALERVRMRVGHTVKIEVEIENEKMLDEAIAAGADMIMFDNCTPEEITCWISRVPPHIATEASGGIAPHNLSEYAHSGVQWISLGYLTHSVKALDISADVVT